MEGPATVSSPKSDFDQPESILPGFSEARGILNAADDSVFPLGYKGNKFDFYSFANRYRMGVLS